MQQDLQLLFTTEQAISTNEPPLHEVLEALGTRADSSGHHGLSKHEKLPSAQMSMMGHCCSWSACQRLEAPLPHARRTHQMLFWSSR